MLIWLSLEDKAEVCQHNDWEKIRPSYLHGFHWNIKRKSAYTMIGKCQTVMLLWLLLEDKAEVCQHNDWKISDCHTYIAFIGR